MKRKYNNNSKVAAPKKAKNGKAVFQSNNGNGNYNMLFNKAFLGPEKKSLDTHFDLVCGSNPVITPLNLVGQGTAFYQRDGSKLIMDSLQIAAYLYFKPQKTSNHLTVTRLLLIYDESPNGALPVIDTILQDYLQDGTATRDITSGINLNYRSRFQILRDRHVMCPPVVTDVNAFPTAGGFQVTTVDEKGHGLFWGDYIRLPGKITQFNNVSATPSITGVSNGAIYLIALNDLDIGTSAFGLYGKARFRFSDVPKN